MQQDNRCVCAQPNRQMLVGLVSSRLTVCITVSGWQLWLHHLQDTLHAAAVWLSWHLHFW